MTPDAPEAPAAPAFSLASLSVAGTAAVPDISNGVPVEWRVKRFSVAEATRAGLLSGVIGAAVAQSQPSAGAEAAPAGAVIESTIRAMLDGGEKAVLAAVTGVRAQGSDVWTDCQIVPVGKGEDPAAGRLSILSVSAAGQIAITQEAMRQALEAVQSVGSFRAG
jgi:hypothetical protein